MRCPAADITNEDSGDEDESDEEEVDEVLRMTHDNDDDDDDDEDSDDDDSDDDDDEEEEEEDEEEDEEENEREGARAALRCFHSSVRVHASNLSRANCRTHQVTWLAPKAGAASRHSSTTPTRRTTRFTMSLMTVRSPRPLARLPEMRALGAATRRGARPVR